jgi:hypothetical protein
LTCSCLASLETDFEKCIIIVDFTKWGMVIDGNVHCFVMCVLFGEEKKDGMYFRVCFPSYYQALIGSQVSNISISLLRVRKKGK